jgi:signal transduction histidine kinase
VLALAVLALAVVAAGFFGLGLWRERVRGERALRALREELRPWRDLHGGWTWQADATHRLLWWRAPPSAADAPGLPRAPAPDALASLLASERPFGERRVDGPDGAWLCTGEPLRDDAGRCIGFVGQARPAAQDDDAALARAAIDPLLAACPGPALLATRADGAWQVLRANAAAGLQWPRLAALAAGDGHGSPASSPPVRLGPETVPGLSAAVTAALSRVAPGHGVDVEGWRVAALAAGAGVEGLLLARLGAPAEADAFGPTLSHDLRAPIRVVEGFTRIVKEDYGRVLDRVANDHLERVLGAAARMNHMIDALLTLSRLSSQPLSRQPVNLTQLATYVVDDLRRGAPERQVEVEIEAGLTVHGDPTLLRMVLENLLSNAWKYTARTPRPRITLRRTEEGGRPRFELADNGAGFDMRSADRLFGLFQRLHSQNDFPGHGVGLASVRRIVQRHGGEIWASAEPGRGATFSFTLG